MDKKKTWMYISIGSIVLSLASLLLPIISYKSAVTRQVTRYNIFGLLGRDEFIKNVFGEYTGTFLRNIEYSEVSLWIILICAVGVAAIVFAFVGIRSMTKQYESAVPFRLAIGGLIGTMIPAIILLTLYIVAKDQYAGTLHLGAYIVITPIAMALACLTVTGRHRLTQEEAKIQAEARAYIRPAGDLPQISRQRGNQYYGQ